MTPSLSSRLHGPQAYRRWLPSLGLRLAAIGRPASVGMAMTVLASLATAQSHHRPNLLVITADDHASHALSCYGSRINETPQLDRLARSGARFANAFVTDSLCGPSRAVMLTGKYTHLNGFARNGDVFDGSQPTVAKYLQAAGYHTATVGKWHLASDPTGFDWWSVLPGQGIYHDPDFIEMGERKRYHGYVSDIITDLALQWLEKQRGSDQPFYLLLQHKAPHRRWEPAERYMHLYADHDVPEPETLTDDWSGRGTAAHVQEMTIAHHLQPADLKQDPPEGLSERELLAWKYQRFIKDYLRCVASVDDNVGRVLDWLDRTGLADDTVVVYISDQGFFLGDHGWFDKRFMYEESLRTPLLIRWPGVTEPGSVIDQLALNLDLPETLLDIAGEPIPADMQGQSLVPLLRGEDPADWRQSIYYRYYEHPAVHNVHQHFGVRTARYKLIRYPELDEWELFDLQRDPHELLSVYDDPSYAGPRQQLTAELHRLQDYYGDDGTVWDPRADEARQVPASVALAEPLGEVAGDAPWAVHDSAELDPSYKPFAVEATVGEGNGMVVAQGGENEGYALFVQAGVPHFAVRSRGTLHEVAGSAPLAGRHHLAGVLTPDAHVELWVDGERVATGAGAFIAATPAEPFEVGADTDSPVTAEIQPPFDGTLTDVTLRWGKVPADVRAAWQHLR